MSKPLYAGRIRRFAASLLLLFAISGMVLFSSEMLAAAKNGITICLEVIIPSLFPFFVFSTLAVDFGLAGYAGMAMEKGMRRLFNVGGACAPALILGLIGGYPVGAKTALMLYEKKLCTKTEAERLLAFCNNSGPAFILGAVGAGIFQSARAGMLLYLSHVLAAVTVGFFFRFYKPESRALKTSISGQISFVRASTAFLEAVKSSFSSVLNVCAFVIFFSVVIKMLSLFQIIPSLARLFSKFLSPLGLQAAWAEQMLNGFVEVTSGLWSLSQISGAIPAKLAMAAFMLGWAGLSVHCQVLSFLGNSDLSVVPYLSGKLLHAVTSAVYALLLLGFFPVVSPASASLTNGIGIVSDIGFIPSLLFGLKASLLFWVLFPLPSLFLRGKRHGKVAKR